MRNPSRRAAYLLAGLFFTTTLSSFAIGQIGKSNTGDPVSSHEDDIPDSVLLTERGSQLAFQLRQLRKTEATLGSKHPSLSSVQAQIAKVKAQLAALSADAQQDSGIEGKPRPDAVADMNDQQLRQLIQRMSIQIERLEKRVETLERRQVF